MLPVIQELNAEGKLTEAQQLILAKTKPVEELYDLQADPYELNNLARSPKQRDELNKLRSLLDAWIADTGDKGLPLTPSHPPE
jgi:arylsulfatase A-like enzyme